MLNKDYTEKLLEIKGIIVEKIENFDKEIHIHFSLERKTHSCPCCGCETNKVHDYRKQVIKDISILGKNTFLHYKKRRYVCSKCIKKFYEKNDFVAKYYRHTKRLFKHIIHKLRNVRSFSDVSKEENVSSTTTCRYFKKINYSKPISMPRVLSIDEFKGNTRQVPMYFNRP